MYIHLNFIYLKALSKEVSLKLNKLINSCKTSIWKLSL